jgi:hypothetical protein
LVGGELAIVRAKVPGIGARLSAEIVHVVQVLRRQDLFKAPGVAETLDWAAALVELDAVALDPAMVSDTLGVLLKYQDDIAPHPGLESAGADRPDARGAEGGGVGGRESRLSSTPRWFAESGIWLPALSVAFCWVLSFCFELSPDA